MLLGTGGLVCESVRAVERSRSLQTSSAGTPRLAHPELSSVVSASLTVTESGLELRRRLAKAIVTDGVVDANVHLERIAREVERVKGGAMTHPR